jgi:4-amino-4-deoxy-L-arabinose transferase-like glycosyltransferase
MTKKQLGLALALLLILSLALRLVAITRVPPGLNNDEVVNGYEAYSLLKTSQDQWGNFLPLEFKGFGDFKPPTMIYLIIPFIKLLGLNSLAVRLPVIIFSLLTLLVAYQLIKELFSPPVAFFNSRFISVCAVFFGRYCSFL